MKDSSEHHRIIVEKGGQRLDVFLKEHFSHLSRSSLQKLIHEGKVTVNKKVEKPSHLLKTGDKIDIIITPLKETVLVPEPLPLDILFEDDYLLVLNKPAGMTTHPVYPGQKGTLVNALLYHTKNLSQMGGLLRPGIVHRLDKDTSGAIVVAKCDFVHLALSLQFKKREVKKKYLALVKGKPSDAEGIINVKIGRSPKGRGRMVPDGKLAREAITYYKTLKSWGDWSLLEVHPLTGRTHQIRIHLKTLNCFLIGDRLYGGKPGRDSPVPVNRAMLHANLLGFFHPAKKEWMEFEAPMPQDMKNVINYLERKK
ncbi:RluA family pseudouridine synthase [Candidatus Aerophobetes bacterium]|uniref:Pseudouridine synthase n=1 Tax=Aerophobetes bacterium TaxID=2030807 RepID=A0A662DNN8_UNCAE|nr:MAG: RluA family pseudouridine synthase [Candidatus Aerophobetes bacterium]